MIELLKTTGWEDYELLDSGDGYRLERFGKYVLQRPDPQIIWKKKLPNLWDKADAIFKRDTSDKGHWVKKNSQMPNNWQINYKNLKFILKLTNFKHTGVFPEQHLMWDFISDAISTRISEGVTNKGGLPMARSGLIAKQLPNEHQREGNVWQDPDGNQINILNLFAYTGISTIVAASAGAKVTHIDASKPTITWAHENQKASNLDDKLIRWILDDATKFVQREIKRGIKYDGIIMDPPVFGHGPDGSMWKFNESFPKLLTLVKQVLSDKPLFIIINAYAISSSALMLKNVMEDYFSDLDGKFEVGELVLLESKNKRPLSTGIFGRWSFSN